MSLKLCKRCSAAYSLIAAVICLALLSAALAQNGSSGVEVPAFFYIFGGSGAFVKLDVRSGNIISSSTLSSVQENRHKLPEFVTPASHTQNAAWLASNLVYDPKLHRIYGVFPAASGDESHPVTITSIDIPDMTVRAQLPVASAPNMIIGEGGQFILSSALRIQTTANAETILSTFVVYNADTLTPERQYSQTFSSRTYMLAAEPDPLRFHLGAHLSKDGSLIYDRLTKIVINRGKPSKRTVNPISLMNQKQLVKLDLYKIVDPISHKSYIPLSFVSSAASFALLKVCKSEVSRCMLVNVDLDTPKIVAMADVPEVRARFTPDASKIVAEVLETHGSAATQKALHDVKGQVLVLDSKSGQELVTANYQQFAGNAENHRILCSEPDGKWLLYEAGPEIYLLSGSMAQKPQLVRSSLRAGPETTCLYTDR